MTRPRWNPQGRPKGKKHKKRRDDQDERPRDDDRPPSQAESLEAVRDLLLHVLLIQTCPLCASTGRIPDGNPVENGKPASGWTVCACRRQAWGLLAEFSLGPMAEEEEDVAEDDGDEGKDEDFEEVRR